MKKLMKLFTIIFILLVSVFGTMENVSATPAASLQLGPATDMEPYIAGMRFMKMTVSNGGYAYCVDITKDIVQNTTVKLVGEKDSGFTYLLENGYPNKSITGNADYDYYITQTAIWWYLDDTTGSSNLTTNFKTNGSDNYDLKKYVIALKNGALNAKNTGFNRPSLSITADSTELVLTEDKKFYETTITPTVNNVTEQYKINLDSAPEGTIVTDLSNNIKESFTIGEKFKVRIPIEKVSTGANTIKLTVSGTGTYYKAYQYKSDNDKLQEVVVSVLEPIKEPVRASITLNVTTTKVTVLKIDKDTEHTLAGATIILKDKDGNIIEKIVSEENGYLIAGLPYGDYTIEEAIAPDGYILNNQPISFTLDDNNKDLTIKVYNIKATCENGGITEGCEIVVIPQTSTTTTILYILGTLIFVLGIGYIRYNAKKQK